MLQGEPSTEPPTPRVWPSLARSLVLGLIVLGLYLANGREIGTYDTEPASMLTLTLVRGEGFYLDRFGPTLYEPDGRLSPYVARSGRHLVSRYPVAPALLAVPFAWPYYAYLDATRIGWDRDPSRARMATHHAAKIAAALLAAMAIVGLDLVLRRLGFGRAGTVAAFTAAVGSNLWTVGSQALWQHGPAVLMLVLALLALTGERLNTLRLTLAGLATAIMVACRAIDVVFAIALLTWVAWFHPRRLPAFLVAPVLIGGALLAYNTSLFGTATGGQQALEAMHEELHDVSGVWNPNPLPGLMGTLLSPARGLLVFCPWVALAMAVLPWSRHRIPARSAACWVVVALVPYLLVVSCYRVWWAGHTFGPRYWVDATPALAILLAAAMAWSAHRTRALLPLFAITIFWSVGVQVLGASQFPTGWNLSPTNIDRDHARLWDWNDTELRRCLDQARVRRGPDGG